MTDDAVLVFSVVLLTILFWGDPDLHDALLHYLMGPDSSTTTE